jgi:IS30 family transposase
MQRTTLDRLAETHICAFSDDSGIGRCSEHGCLGSAVLGHWEGDLVLSSANSEIAILVDRQARYVMLVKLEGKDSQ